MDEISILIVDDNPAIHIDFKKILESKSNGTTQSLEAARAAFMGKPPEVKEFNFVFESAYQGDKALQIISNGLSVNHHYAVAFVDIRMPPGLDGVETARLIWELDAEIQIVLCTAYSDYSWEDLTKQLGNTDRWLILKKPFENIEVLQLANSLSKKWQINQNLKTNLQDLEKLVNNRTVSLAKYLSLVRATLEATTDGILVLDKNQKISDYNQKCLQMLNLPRDIIEIPDHQVVEKLITEQLEARDDQKFSININESSENNKQEHRDVLYFKDGRIIEFVSIPQTLENQIIGRVFSFRDITEQKKLEEQLFQQVTHDSLTELPNRIVLYDRIEHAINSARYNGKLVAILFFDLDHFKLINDSLGHDVGDEVLKFIAKQIKSQIRSEDTLARLGGDEFVIVMPNLNKIDDIIPACQDILNKVAESFKIEDQTLNLTASIGISIYPKDGKDAKLLIKYADNANHAVKESGRNQFNFFTMELNVNAKKRLTLEYNLRNALANNEFILHYQPLIEIQTTKIVGVEALLRWKHPKLGLIPPQEFIPVAEETGLMLSIGEWVLFTACAQNKSWQKQGFDPIFMSVNLTAKQFLQSNIVATIADVLQRTELDPQYLEVELTESTIIESTDRVVRVMHELKSSGIRIAIDDFGTGYSNLNYMSHLPVDKIKIDRSFISYISPHSKDVAVITAIIAIAKSLQIKSLAEGVETQEQFDFLRWTDCNQIQGNYFYRPEPTEVITKIFQEGQNHQ